MQSLSKLKEVKRLDSLVKAHVLLAVMADKAAPECRLNVLRAYTVVLRIWQVWMDLGLFFFFYQGQIVPALTTIIVNWLCCTIVLLCYCALFVPQVSMEVCHEISVEMTKSPSSPPPSPKKGKGKAQKSKAVSPGIEDFLELT